MTLRFTLNGEEQFVDADAAMPLLWVLRDLLKLRGAKYGCGSGSCGACTVLVDESAIRSCIFPLSAVAGRHVTTIEALGGDHPLQRAWIEGQVPQCGYCQPGQIMQAMALLASNPSPTRSQIREAMSGVLCRCGTYLRIESAIQRVAQELNEEAKDND
jgi:aerobic-type carbon monoxide dehydrogenase small subunit (CoxS/CutS family)